MHLVGSIFFFVNFFYNQYVSDSIFYNVLNLLVLKILFKFFCFLPSTSKFSLSIFGIEDEKDSLGLIRLNSTSLKNHNRSLSSIESK